MHTVFLALGSNVGDKKSHLRRGIELLKTHVYDIRQAHEYETKPVGYKEQDNFLNTVIKGQTNLSPQDLLSLIKTVEQQAGRIVRFRWGPREIDIDLLFYDDLIFKDATLEIPHPRLHQRDFVLQPLAQLAPDLVHPIMGKTVKRMLEEFPKEERSVIGTPVN